MSHMFLHGGITKRDWFSDTEFKAFAISITTKTDKAKVIGCGSWNIEHSIPTKGWKSAIEKNRKYFGQKYRLFCISSLSDYSEN